jgi:CRISPR-associated protein Cst1
MVLHYTGHPLIDVGAATIAAFVGKRDLATINEQDLDQVASFIKQHYVINPLKSFLTVAFPNSGFTNPAFEKAPERRLAYADQVIYGYRADRPKLDQRCVFTGKPAVTLAYRQHIPLLTGEDVVNFHPGGNAGLPISGEALLCIQALPLGCAKSAGRLLAVHSDRFDITYNFAKSFLEHNRRALSLAEAAGESKFPEHAARTMTLLIDTLLNAHDQRRDFLSDDRPCSITAYHLSNSGQGVDLAIYPLPLEVLNFLRLVPAGDYREDWNNIVERGWVIARPRKRAQADSETAIEDSSPRRNVLYEDLFHLPERARWFVRRYFLRIPLRLPKAMNDPRNTYGFLGEPDLISWKLTTLFLKKVMIMDDIRIGHIRDLGDRLARYARQQDNGSFFRSFLTATRYDHLRDALVTANYRQVRGGGEPLIRFEQFLEVFEQGEELSRRDWKLARDLVLIRMIEQLHQDPPRWFSKEALPEIVDTVEGESVTTREQE